MSNRNVRQSKKSNRTPEEKRSLTIRIILAILIALGFTFVVFVFVTTNFMGTDNYVTEVLQRTKSSDTISTNAFIVRDEVILESNSSGKLVYSVVNGDKVKNGGVIATAYKAEQDAIDHQEMNDIDEKIKYLQSLGDSNTAVNVGVDSINNQVNTSLIHLIDSVNKRNFSSLTRTEDELMSLIYRKQIITGEQGSFASIIKKLNDRKAELEASSSEAESEIKTDVSGYFVSNLDGYENIFKIKDLEKIYYDDYKSIKKNDDYENENYIGKMITGTNWYLICPITQDDKTTIEHNVSEVYINLPNASTEKMPCQVVTYNQKEGSDEVILVLSCNFMNEALSEIRNETVDVMVSSFEGIKVPKAALHDDYCTKTTYNEDGTTDVVKEKCQGVYVEYGNELLFKPVYILYSGADYVICDENPSSETAYDQRTVSLYDKAVVEGSDLFDGKILE